MIIGNGFIAKGFSSFKDDKKIIIYASGVSSVVGYAEEGSIREEKLLRETIENNPFNKIVYFSTCSVYDKRNINVYTNHKIKMEKVVQEISRNYLIVRLPILVGIGNNLNNLCPYFFNHIKNGTSFNLCQNAYRNIVDIDDVVKTVSLLLRKNIFHNEIVNISNLRKIKVTTIVKIMEHILNKKAQYKLYSQRSYYPVNIDKIRKVIPESMLYKNNYARLILEKYYQSKVVE
jgi:nucleoside-diphosphate-sugar epimerase